MFDTLDLQAAVFAKTPVGQQEIQSRSLGLAPLVRRILVLVDGKRSFTELGALLPEGSDLAVIVQALLDKGCVQVAESAQASMAPSEGSMAESDARADGVGEDTVPDSVGGAAGAAQPRGRDRLPAAATRTVKDNEMARNFMINSVNSIIGQNMRLSLIHDIFHSQTTEQLREVYLHWVESMSDHSMGARRLPELKEKLFKVL